MEDYDAIFEGDYSHLPQEQSSVVRVFLSSTFGGKEANKCFLKTRTSRSTMHTTVLGKLILLTDQQHPDLLLVLGLKVFQQLL